MNRARQLTPTAAPVAPLLEGALELARLLWVVDHGLQVSSRRMQASLGLNGPQRLVLRIVGRFPGLPAALLAQVLHLDPRTVSAVVAGLARRRLVERRRDPRGGPRVLLGLTPRGRALDGPAAGSVEDAADRALRGLPGEKLAAAAEVLGAVAAHLAAADGPAGAP